MLDEVIPWIRAEVEAGPAVTAAAARRPSRRSSRSSCPSSTRARRSSRSCGPCRPASPTPHELLVVYDFDEDTDGPGRRAAGAPSCPALRGLRNDLGRGVLNAMKAGIAGVAAPYVLISMADGSDEPHVVDPMVALARDGADVVSASRYMRGGRQIGGPPLKRLMSRTAGPDPPLVRRRRRPTTRRTTSSSTRAASSTRVTIESTAGFELALELTVKATLAGRRVAEVPTTWRDRTAGKSNFKLRKWLPHYLHWYRAAFRARWLARRHAPAIAARRRPAARPVLERLRPAPNGSACRPGSSRSTCSGSPSPTPSAIDARHYQRAATAWLAGGDPWSVTEVGIRFAAGPHTLLFYAPTSVLPLDGRGRRCGCSWASPPPVWLVRRLGLPLWWLLFPPLLHAVWNGNPQIDRARAPRRSAGRCRRRWRPGSSSTPAVGRC